MSGQQIGAGVGFVAGFFLLGGPQVWSTIGGIVGGYISPTVYKAPSIGDAQTQTSRTGMPIPKAFGHTPPFAPTCVDGDKISRKIKKTQSNGKGAPTETESEGFVATRAFLCCEGEIAAYARIYRNEKLVYSTIEGDNIDADSASFASQLRLYYGSRSQGPDPSLEAMHGVGNTNCYPGRAYFVVVNDDETDTRGAMNQYRVEVIATGTQESTCTEPDLLRWWPLDDAAGGGAARELIAGQDGVYSSGVGSGGILGAGSGGSVEFSDFDQYMVVDSSSIPQVHNMDEWTVSCWAQPRLWNNGTSDVNGGGVVDKRIAAYFGSFFSGSKDWALALTGPSTPAEHKNMTPNGAVTNTAGVDQWDLYNGSYISHGQNVYLAMTWKKNPTGSLGRAELYMNGGLVDYLDDVGNGGTTGHYLVVGGGYSNSDSYQFIGCVSDVKIYQRALTGSEIASKYHDANEWLPLPDGGGFYNSLGEIWVPCSTRATSDAPIWKDVATEICRRADTRLPAVIDFDNMTQQVPGFLLGNPTLKGSDYLRTLLTFYFADAPEYDGKIRTVLRGGAVSGTLDPDDIMRMEDRDDDLREQPIVGWRRLTVTYPDPANKYVPSTQVAPRTSPDVSATSDMNIECPIPFDADTAYQKADILQKIKFCELEGSFKRAFPAEYDKFVPSDPVTFDDRRQIITKKSFDLGLVQIEGHYDRASAYTSVGKGTAAPPPSPQTSNVKGPSILVPFNAPSLRSSDREPGIYVAVRGLFPGWPGCALHISVDAKASWINVATLSVASTLGSFVDDVAVGSNREPITVDLQPDGQVETITDDQFDAGLNRFALITDGIAEIAQFKTADETSAGYYELTDIESETPEVAHSAGDKFVLIDNSVPFIPIDSKYAGTTLYLRAVTLGTPEASNDIVSLVFDPPTFVIDGGTSLS